jgi:hypothetical protein
MCHAVNMTFVVVCVSSSAPSREAGRGRRDLLGNSLR